MKDETRSARARPTKTETEPERREATPTISKQISFDFRTQFHGAPPNGFYRRQPLVREFPGTRVPELLYLLVAYEAPQGKKGLYKDTIDVPQNPNEQNMTTVHDEIRRRFESIVRPNGNPVGPGGNYVWALLSPASNTTNQNPRWVDGFDGVAFEIGRQAVDDLGRPTRDPEPWVDDYAPEPVTASYWICFELM